MRKVTGSAETLYRRQLQAFSPIHRHAETVKTINEIYLGLTTPVVIDAESIQDV